MNWPPEAYLEDGLTVGDDVLVLEPPPETGRINTNTEIYYPMEGTLLSKQIIPHCAMVTIRHPILGVFSFGNHPVVRA